MPGVPEPLEVLFRHIDDNKKKYIEKLKEAVGIESVSCAPFKRKEVVTMVHWVAKLLEKLGCEVEICSVGEEVLNDGRQIPLPPVILAKLGNSRDKPTVCVYGHLDVQPAAESDGWNTQPFVLTEKNGKLYGRGASDDKGPVLAWIHAVEAFQKTGQEVPVNLKFIFEGMEESGSQGLDTLLSERRNTFLSGIDYVCISDNYWLGTDKPCLTYGLRGLCYFEVTVECASKDLHSGVYGGVLNEAMADLCYVMNSLVDAKGKILIPNIMDDVAAVTEAERKLYSKIDFNVYDYKREIGSNQLLHNEDKHSILMNRWRFPSLSIHGIEGAFAEPGQKTVIPCKVVGKFSIRIVPDQTPESVSTHVIRYLNQLWELRGSKNKFEVVMSHGARPWTTDFGHKNFEAAKQATKHVYKVEPDLTREGGSIPVTLTLQDLTGKSVILIPLGACDDGAHSQNEKIDIRNYIEGTKLLGAYLYEIGQIPIDRSECSSFGFVFKFSTN